MLAGQSAMEMILQIDVVYIRDYEDVDGTRAMQNGEDQCCLYIAGKDQFLAGNVAMPSNVNSVCKRSERKLLAGIVAMQSL
jgi:hypothetical protein